MNSCEICSLLCNVPCFWLDSETARLFSMSSASNFDAKHLWTFFFVMIKIPDLFGKALHVNMIEMSTVRPKWANTPRADSTRTVR